MSILRINNDQYLEALNLENNVFLPVRNFMNKKEFSSVVDKMKLPNGKIFPLPIFLSVNKKIKEKVEKEKKISLSFKNDIVGTLFPNDFYTFDKKKIVKKLYGTSNTSHPGVKSFLALDDFFIGGKLIIKKKKKFNFQNLDYSPKEIKNIFKKKGWKTIIGFQTRNIPHIGHEFIHRNAMNKYDGLFIQPLVGQKKKGDFTMEAIIKSYNVLIKKFYKDSKVFFGLLTTSMRYAGPREAIFHSIIRKNFGCTHFIIGRDHAGVGKFYKKYEAQQLAKKIKKKLNIKLSLIKGPFFCKKCDKVTDEDRCKHNEKSILNIDGTKIRRNLKRNIKANDIQFLRKEIKDSLKKIKLFI